MINKPEQPWVKWVQRKLSKAKKKLSDNPNDHVLELKPTLNQRKKLQQNCIVESTLNIWYELGGTSRSKYEAKTGKKVKAEKKDEKVPAHDWGFDIEGEWHGLDTIKTSQIYNALLDKRMRKLKPHQIKTNWALTHLKKWLTPKERDFWWKTAHNLVMVNARKAKWKKEKGLASSDRCPVCKVEKEYWKHYAFDCPGLKAFLAKLGTQATEWYSDIDAKEKWEPPTRDEWDLVDKAMSQNKMIVIAKARWIYHSQRCMMDLKKKKTLDINLLLARVGLSLDKITAMLNGK